MIHRSRPLVAARLHKRAHSGTWRPFANGVAGNVGIHEISGLYPDRPFGPRKAARHFFQSCLGWNDHVESRIQPFDCRNDRARFQLCSDARSGREKGDCFIVSESKPPSKAWPRIPPVGCRAISQPCLAVNTEYGRPRHRRFGEIVVYRFVRPSNLASWASSILS